MFFCFLSLPKVPVAASADVQTLRGLRRLHLPLHLLGSDAGHEGVSTDRIPVFISYQILNQLIHCNMVGRNFTAKILGNDI